MHSRSLRRLISFIKSTVVGGLFVLAPVVLLVIVLGHAANFAYSLIHPLVDWLPVKSFSTVSLAFAIACAALVLVCFLAGLLARTALSQWFVGSAERLVLAFFPSYGLMKSMGQGWVGITSDEPHQPVLVQFDDNAQIGFVMDTLPDDRRVVFIPDVPTPWSGQLVFVAANRLSPLTMTTKQTIDCLQRLGVNTSRQMAQGQTVH